MNACRVRRTSIFATTLAFALLPALSIATNPSDDAPSFAAWLDATQPALGHSDTCPRNCKTCDAIVKQALDWLAGQQTEHGYWKSHLLDGRRGTWENTAMAMLAFLANGSDLNQGPYRENLRRASDYVLEQLPAVQEQNPVLNWSTGFLSLALAELYARHREDRFKEALEYLNALIAKNQQVFPDDDGRGGWGHLSRNYGIKDDVTMYGAFVAPSLWNMAALGITKQQGLAVDDAAYRRGLLYLQRSIHESGGVNYYSTAPSKAIPKPDPVQSAARSAAMIWVLERCGARDEAVEKKLGDYFVPRLHLTHKGHGAVVLHYLSGGLGSRLLGAEPQKKYWAKFRDKMLEERNDDHAFQNRWLKKETIWWYEIRMGDSWSTATFALLWQLDGPHLKTFFGPIAKVEPLPREKDSGSPLRKLAKGDAPPPRANLGISWRTTPDGCKLTAVAKGSPAEAAGLKVDDVLVSFAGAPLDDQALGGQKLAKNLKESRPGREVTLAVRRGAERVEIDAKLGQLKSPHGRP